MKFNYQAFDQTSKIKKGVVEAANLKEAARLLLGQGWYIKKIKPVGIIKTGFGRAGFNRVSLLEKVLFAKHLATMIKSGITLNEALTVVVEQASSKKFKNIVSAVLNNIKSGRRLSDSLAAFPKTFDPLFINIIRVGEESGTLESNLEYLAGELEDRLDLRQKVKTASFYPAIVLLSTVTLILVLGYFVLPKIKRLFTTLSFQLPLSTKILLWLAEVMDRYGLAIIFGFIFGVIFLRIIISQRFIKPWWHRLLLKLPVIGSIIINYNLVLINRTLSILLKSGLTIDRSIVISSETLKNLVYQQYLKKVLPQVQKGKGLAEALAAFKQSARRPLFPLLVIKMIGVGEKTGELDESFAYLAEYFEKEVDNATKNLTTTLEPILLIIVGLLVGFVAISVISPIYQVTGQLRR